MLTLALEQAPPPRPAPLQQRRRAFHGTLVHALSLTDTEYLHNALIGVDEAGVIAFVDKSVSADEVELRLNERGWEQAHVVRLAKGEFLMPGCVPQLCLSPSDELGALTSSSSPSSCSRSEQAHRHARPRAAVRQPVVRSRVRAPRLARPGHVPGRGQGASPSSNPLLDRRHADSGSLRNSLPTSPTPAAPTRTSSIASSTAGRRPPACTAPCTTRAPSSSPQSATDEDSARSSASATWIATARRATRRRRPTARSPTRRTLSPSSASTASRPARRPRPSPRASGRRHQPRSSSPSSRLGSPSRAPTSACRASAR